MEGEGFFDAHQRETVEAAMARIIPADDQPGAREAGTIEFLDRYLSGLGYIYAKPDGSGFETLEGKRADAWRQRAEILREKYISGVKELDERSRERFGQDFARLDIEQQDSVLAELERPVSKAEEALTEAEQGPGSRRWRRRCSRPVSSLTWTSSRCWPCTPARASTPTRSTAVTGTGSAGR